MSDIDHVDTFFVGLMVSVLGGFLLWALHHLIQDIRATLTAIGLLLFAIVFSYLVGYLLLHATPSIDEIKEEAEDRLKEWSMYD